MAKLPEEITMEILSLLPSKALARFRCVSQSWNSLQYDHEFAKMRFENAPQQPRIGAQKLLISSYSNFACLDCETLPCNVKVDETEPMEEVDITELDFPFKKPNLAVKIIGSCNGLVCVAPNSVTKDIFLWNPSTDVYRKLPDPEIPDYQGCCYCYGLGYDSVSEDYKIIIITHESKEGGESAHVFSLKANSWKKLPNPHGSYNDIAWTDTPTGLLYNGALHWFYEIGKIIYAFDLGTEKFYEVPFPEEIQHTNFHDLGVLKGCLCLTRSLPPQIHISGELMLLKKENPMGTSSSWVLVDEFQAPNHYPFGVYALYMKILCVTRGGAHIVKADRSSLVMYNPQEKQHYIFDVCGEAFETIPYIENLNSPYSPFAML